MADETDLDIDDAGFEALEGRIEDPPKTSTPPPVPGQPAPAERPQTVEGDLGEMSTEEKIRVLENLKKENALRSELIAKLEDETQQMDGVGFCTHGLHLCDRLFNAIRPIKLGGDVVENEVFAAFEEIKEWFMQGLTVEASTQG